MRFPFEIWCKILRYNRLRQQAFRKRIDEFETKFKVLRRTFKLYRDGTYKFKFGREITFSYLNCCCCGEERYFCFRAFSSREVFFDLDTGETLD